MKCLQLLFVLLFLSTITINAQHLEGDIHAESDDPVIGAYLSCAAKNIHAHTDINGRFVFKNIAIGDTLEISHLGFKAYKKLLTAKDFESPLQLVLEEDYFTLDQIAIDNKARTAYQVTDIDLSLKPVSSSHEVLRSVPGLIIGQHAGGGKAEQIFLRGFDIDHGTDITLTVDGLPVNMVSHAHGQGYADLHFVIPETIENIEFGKGPYYADQGNFNTAGYVNFKTKDKIKESVIGIALGQFNTSRLYSVVNLIQDTESNHSAYIASEFLQSDGPFESEQNFDRFNLMGKYIVDLKNDDRLSLQFSHFKSQWYASGQIPQRLVDSGELDRFGAVDDTEGGNTKRTNVALNYTKNISDNSFVKIKSYYVDYEFELFSNFTFFLNNPINGDQIRQYENRQIYGFESNLFNTFIYNDYNIELESGIGIRSDDVNDNQLSYTINRTTLNERLSYGNIDETNLFVYTSANFEIGHWLINPSIRIDHFEFNYVDHLQTQFEAQSISSTIATPNIKLIYNPNRRIQYYLKSGFGFHSNDSRVVVAQSGEKTLPYAFGSDLGIVWKPRKDVWLSAALWHLNLNQEFVYVGDEAIVEPSGQTTRKGIEFSSRIALSRNLFFNTDITYTHAQFNDAEEGNNSIPLAPIITSSGGLSYSKKKGLSGSINYRYIMDRPANEDESITAEGYFIVDANASYRFTRVQVGISIENLLNSEWNEAQFATESRLLNETTSVEELHFTPGTPFTIRGNIAYRF